MADLSIRITLSPVSLALATAWIRTLALLAPVIGRERAYSLAQRGAVWLLMRRVRMQTEVER